MRFRFRKALHTTYRFVANNSKSRTDKTAVVTTFDNKCGKENNNTEGDDELGDVHG